MDMFKIQVFKYVSTEHLLKNVLNVYVAMNHRDERSILGAK